MAPTVLGRALYLEFHKDTYATQIVITPAMVHPKSGSIISSALIHRQLSEDMPRRQWKFRLGGTPPELATQNGKFIPSIGISNTLDIVDKQVAPIHKHILLMEKTGWVLQKMVAVEISSADAVDIHDQKTPVAFMSRVSRARLDAGLPESVWPVVPVSPSSVVL